MQNKPRVALLRILREAIEAAGGETSAPPLDAVHRIALLQQQLG